MDTYAPYRVLWLQRVRATVVAKRGSRIQAESPALYLCVSSKDGSLGFPPADEQLLFWEDLPKEVRRIEEDLRSEVGLVGDR